MMQDASVPLEYSLSAYPNPFNATTTLSFGVKERGLVTLAVFNIAGQEVGTLVNRSYEAGVHSVQRSFGRPLARSSKHGSGQVWPLPLHLRERFIPAGWLHPQRKRNRRT